jgi:hypothetical protein
VIDLAAGHGLLAQLMIILDDGSPSATAIDHEQPPSAEKIARALREEWPRLEGRFTYLEASLDALPIEIVPSDVIVSSHACGPLTDRVLDLAIAARARVAVLPCCHHVGKSQLSGLDTWVDGSIAMDVLRASRLMHAGYRVHGQRIPEEITPKNRLLIAEPGSSPGD